MSRLRTPEAAIDETRLASLPASENLSSNRLHDRRTILRTLVASTMALGLGGATIAITNAQEAPPDVPVDDTSTDTETTDTSSETTDTTSADSSVASGSGQAIADFALQYVGYPYVSAGRDPSTGFDCSGFTSYVVMNVLGIDIGGGVEGQVGYGSPVEYGAWQPGDLVFFANTYREGLSHVGIAIGGSQMVHAENESTGVTISDITSDYYTSHYASASRLA